MSPWPTGLLRVPGYKITREKKFENQKKKNVINEMTQFKSI